MAASSPISPIALDNGTLLIAKSRLSFDYIELPVQLLYSPTFSFGKPWIGGGFYPAVLLSPPLVSLSGKSATASGEPILGIHGA
jgi:hypothetical protein